MSLFRKEPRFDWEDTRPFTGASATGLPDTGTVTAQDTAPLDRLRARRPQPDTFPALTDDTRDTGPLQRMPRFTRVQQRPRPDRPYDAAIFTWSKLLGQFIMLCGTCPPERRSRYADPVAGHMPFSFEALRVSAYVSGWRLDAFARWACPACQQTPQYRAPYPVTHSHPELRRLHAAGMPVKEPVARAVLDAEPYGEFAVAVAEHDLIRDVTGATRQGRHAVGAP